MKVSIGAGHNPPEDYGAVNSDLELYEYIEAHKVVSYSNDALKISGFDVHNFCGTLKQKVKSINRARPDIAIEVHFNSSTNKKARGGLVMYYPSEKSELLAKSIERGLRDSTSIPIREIFEGHFRLDPKRPYLYILRKTRCPCVVLEPLFISNHLDGRLLEGGTIHRIIAGAILIGVKEYAKMMRD